MTDFDDLNALLKDSRRAQHAEREAKAAASTLPIRQPQAQPAPQELYANPDNWQRTRGIALIHEETQSLLGNFTEYVHRSVAGARRLVLELTPMSISATESVSGDWWITKVALLQKRVESSRRAMSVLDIELDRLGVHAPSVGVEIHSTAFHGIARVELLAPTSFAALAEGVTQVLKLPAGVNILPSMSRESKLVLRKAVEL